MDYGVPTLYLGWPKGIKDERGKEITDGYFHSRLFAHITLHEFGHALGLPHLHQHPELENPFKSAPTVQAVLLEKMGIEMSEAEVIEELILRWPGSTAYGDWLDIGNQTGPELAARSVMMGLPAQQVYRAETSSGLEYFTALGELDTQWIQALYGR